MGPEKKQGQVILGLQLVLGRQWEALGCYEERVGSGKSGAEAENSARKPGREPHGTACSRLNVTEMVRSNQTWHTF